MDLEHTCNWQIGTDDNGDPIYCNININHLVTCIVIYSMSILDQENMNIIVVGVV